MCDLVTNSALQFRVKLRLSSPEAAVISSLLTSGAQVERLDFKGKLMVPAFELARGIIQSGSVRILRAGYFFHSKVSIDDSVIATIYSSMCATLEEINIYNIRISEVSCKELGKGLRLCSSLRKLEIRLCIPSARFGFMPGIGHAPSLESICFSGTRLGREPEEELAVELCQLPSLRELYVAHTGVGAKFASIFAKHPQLRRLRSLDLSGLVKAGLAVVIDGLAQFSWVALQDLGLSCCSIDPLLCGRAAEVVRRAPFLRSLDLSFNEIGLAGARAIGQAIKSSCKSTLSELNVDGCKLDAPGMVALFGPLCGGCGALTHVKSSQNNSGEEGTRAIAACLSGSGQGRGMIELGMYCNGITPAAAKDLAGGLCMAYSMRIIDLRRNELGPEGAAILFDALAIPFGCRMETVDLNWCKIGDLGAEAVSRLVLRRGCERLYLDSNDITAKGVKAIVDAVVANYQVHRKVMKSLLLLRNPVGDEGAVYIAERMLVMGVVQLEISSIGMKDAGARAVADSIIKRKKHSVFGMVTVSDKDCSLAGKLALQNAQRLEHINRRAEALNIFP